MADYICRNCGHMQCSSGTNGGCAYTFWFLLLIITIFIGLFFPVAFIVVAFEVLFLILTSRNPDSNFCFKCKARGCVVPFNTPAGQQLYKTFYPDEYEEKKQKEEQERQRKVEEAQAREDAGLSYLDKFHIEEPSMGKFLLFLLISAAIIFILFLSLSGIRTLIGAAPNKEVAATPQAQTQQQVKPAAKPQPKPVPVTFENSPALQARYREEIEKVIDTETVKVKKEIDKIYNESDALYSQILSNNDFTIRSFEEYESYTMALEGPVFHMYVNLKNITEKHTGKHKELATGYYGALADYVEPIMRKYGVSNINKVSEVETYMANKSQEISTRAEGIRKIVYGVK
uniref:Zinc binding domain n=1 Tax=Myoviridae sp. ctsip2 TaxID=2826705 RepID=A0A8S5N592_9CAUD|nr:MAG TPA: Putative zinc binding domain [Myoviridae sp. ctsip2]